MFKIGEFSRLGQVSIRMLRYYDTAGLLRPIHIDMVSGYRYYSAPQLDTLRKIVFLRDMGFTIAEIAELLEGWSQKRVKESLLKKREETHKVIRVEYDKVAAIDSALTMLSTKKTRADFPVLVKATPEVRVASLRKVIPGYFAKYDLWKELYDTIGKENAQPLISGENIGIYHDSEYKDTDIDLEACILLTDELTNTPTGLTIRTLESVTHMASLTVFGHYKNTIDAFGTLAMWLENTPTFKMLDYSRQICHVGPWNEPDPQNFVTEIQIPLTSRLLIFPIFFPLTLTLCQALAWPQDG